MIKGSENIFSQDVEFPMATKEQWEEIKDKYKVPVSTIAKKKGPEEALVKAIKKAKLKREKVRKTTKRISAKGNVYYYKYKKNVNLRRKIDNALRLYGSYLPKGANELLLDEIMKIISIYKK